MNASVPSSTQFGIAVLRVSLGAMWIAHALLKLLVFTLPGTAQYFASIGFPGFMAYPVFLIAASISLWLLGDDAAAIKRSTLLVPHFRAA